MLSLVSSRRSTEKLDVLRASGHMPAVMYGSKHESVSLSILVTDFAKLMRSEGHGSVISLSVDGVLTEVLLKDVSVHPVTSAPIHADFFILEAGRKVTVSLPLEFIGVSEAEKSGAHVVKVMHELEVEIAPQDIPKHLIVDLALLVEAGDHILVKDIALPASAEALVGAEEIVANAAGFKEIKFDEVAEVKLAATPQDAKEAAKTE
jgi:large subunit ribosomal protein L25